GPVKKMERRYRMWTRLAKFRRRPPQNSHRPMTIAAKTMCHTFMESPQLQKRQTRDRHERRHDPEPERDLRFRHAAKLKVMVERRDQKHPLPRRLVAQDLQERRARLDHEDAAHEEEQQLLLRRAGDQ